jgi:hypothetical protein
MGGLERRHRARVALVLCLGAAVPSPVRAELPPQAGASAGWLEQVTKGIHAAEYHLSPAKDGGWTAPNRKQDLRAAWRDGQLVVRPRVDGTAWAFTYRLVSLARKAHPPEVDVACVSREGIDEDRLEWEHPGIVEWYVNAERGIEQGFTLTELPAGDPQESVVIEGLIDGLLAYPAEDGQSILLRTAAGVDAMRIRELVVRDANGVDLHACLSIATGSLQISIDDRDATYPVTVDPLMASPAWTAEGDQAGAGFGQSVATAGDVNDDGYSDVIVGASLYDNGQGDEGRAFAYLGSVSGLGLAPAWIVESNRVASHFGSSVATAGDVNGDGYSDVIVGAPAYTNGQSREGLAFAYLGSASGLAATPAWTAEGDQVDADFGSSVAAAGDVNGDGYSDVIVGADGYDNGQIGEGRAFAYYGSASGLGVAPAWTAESDQGLAGFGISVATAGDVNGDGYSDVIVGANRYEYDVYDEGAAFAYYGSASGLSVTPNWRYSGLRTDQELGISVATAGDVNGDGYSDVIVGAWHYVDGSGAYLGAAYAFMGSTSGLATTYDWFASGGYSNAQFGRSVATAGDVNGDGYSDVIVGASRDPSEQEAEAGYVEAFYGSAEGLDNGSWDFQVGQGYAHFGISVATAGDVNGDGYSDVIVGADGYDDGEIDEGGAFLFNGAPDGLGELAGWRGDSGQGDALMGGSVATAGDVNGDGYSDVIVGAERYDNGEDDEGGAFAYLGSTSGLGTSAAWMAEGEQAGAAFGSSVASAGDVNGDGYSDVIVGADRFDDGEDDEGRAFAYLGSASGLTTTPAWTIESDQPGALLGNSVATAGDVNGDGYSDVIVGARAYSNGELAEGAAFGYLGSAAGLATSPSWTAEGDQPGANFGACVATAGDVNGDGYSDVIVGANTYDNGETDEGRAFAYLGGPSGLGTTPAWTAESQQVGAELGVSVGTAGDVNGDGYSDVIVGARLYTNGEISEGRAFVHLGSAAGLATTPAWTAESDQAGAELGVSVATAGDVNGDGYSDVIVGAWTYDDGRDSDGRALAYFGSASGLGLLPAWTAESGWDRADLGWCVATAGDVNGDGYSDVIVGALAASRAFVYYGNEFDGYGDVADGLDRIPRQARAALVPPIDNLGGVTVGDGFAVRANGRSPFGRDDVRLEVEVKPLGTAFDGAGVLATPYTDTGEPGASGSVVDLSQSVPTPVEGPLHWRARLRGRSSFPWLSHWMSAPANGRTETDLRVLAVNPVTCEAGPPKVALCHGGAVTLDASGSSGPPPLAFLWSSNAAEISIASPTSPVTDVTVLAAGTFTVRLDVTNGSHSAACTTTVTATDLMAPTLACPGAVVAAPTQPAAAFVSLAASVADDCDAAVVVTNDRTAGGADASDDYPCGDTLVTFTATDAAGHVATCATTVAIADIAPPLEVSAAAASVPLRVTKEAAVSRIYVSFEDRGAPGELFNLYAGTILPTGLVAYDHAPVACKVIAWPTTPGVLELSAPLDAGSHYYLVSASNCAGESTRGFRSDGVERPSFPTDCGSIP